MAKKYIVVINPKSIEFIIENGFNGIQQKINNNQNYMAFEFTDELKEFLNQPEVKEIVTLKDYFYDKSIRF